MGPHRCITGSSGLVSGWICILPSQRAADDLEGSKLAGLDNPVGDCGAQPAPMDDAMSVGTIVMMDGLNEWWLVSNPVLARRGKDNRKRALK